MQTEIPAAHITAQRNLFGRLQLLSQEHGISRDGSSALWAFAAVDGLTVETGKAKLINVLETDNFEKRSLSLSALLRMLV